MNRYISIGIFVSLLILILSPIAHADETAELWRENNSGMNVILTSETPNVIQIVSTTTAVDTTITLDFPGNPLGGIAFTWNIRNSSAAPDSIIKYYMTQTSEFNMTRTAADSTIFVIEPQSERIIHFLLDEGDPVRWIHGSGNGILEIGGVKNLRGLYKDDF